MDIVITSIIFICMHTFVFFFKKLIHNIGKSSLPKYIENKSIPLETEITLPEVLSPSPDSLMNNASCWNRI